MILNQSQAEAVYSAMCALNNVGARATRIAVPGKDGDDDAAVVERPDGAVVVLGILGSIPFDEEIHASQSAFAAAYGLQQG